MEGTEPLGQYVDAEDILGRSEEEGDVKSGAESESETESEGSETESESGSETESQSETESGSETESESETETEAESAAPSKEPTALGEVSQAQSLPPVAGGSRPASPAQEASTAQQDGEGAGDPEASLQHLPPLESSRPATPAQQDEQDEEQQGREDDQEEPQHLQLPPVESSRPSSSQPAGSLAGDGPSEAAPLSLPPANSRPSSRECSRKSSHLEATSTGSVLGQSSDSLPPIKALSPSSSFEPTRKASMASSQAASKPSRGVSPKQGSPTRNPISAPRYYKPPPPPPPPPKPKPREKHDTSAVDPLFLQTAVYRTVPGVGKVYDWQLQHEVNAALSKQRKQQAQMEKVLEAARVQLQVREANERAFQQWVATKEMEKQQQKQQNRRIAYVTSVYTNLIKDDPVERKTRESSWVSNFAYPTSDNIPARVMVRGNLTDSGDRFRT